MPPVSNVAHLTQPVATETVARRWGAVVSLRYPAEVSRHPGLSRIIRETVGRICATESTEELLRFTFGAEGESEWEARADSQQVIERVLGRLGLAQDSIEDAYLVDERDTDPRVVSRDRHLSVLPDLDE